MVVTLFIGVCYYERKQTGKKNYLRSINKTCGPDDSAVSFHNANFPSTALIIFTTQNLNFLIALASPSLSC